MLPLITRAELLIQGYDDHDIRRLVTSGTLLRAHRGVYAWARPAGDVASPEQQHLLLARAAARAAHAPMVLSHVTAAVAHGLPVPRRSLSHVHLLNPTGTGGSDAERVRLTHGALITDDVTRIDGLAVTSLPRTLADLGRTLEPGWALAALDEALRERACSEAEVQAVLARMRGIPGIRKARRVLGLADARAESPAESLSRMMLVDAGLPPDDLQRVLPYPGGEDRVDFWWDAGVVGEFDGELKYHAHARPGLTPAQVLWAEKQREDRIRRQGYVVVRWTWDELMRRPDRIIAELQTALADARARRGQRAA